MPIFVIVSLVVVLAISVMAPGPATAAAAWPNSGKPYYVFSGKPYYVFNFEGVLASVASSDPRHQAWVGNMVRGAYGLPVRPEVFRGRRREHYSYSSDTWGSHRGSYDLDPQGRFLLEWQDDTREWQSETVDLWGETIIAPKIEIYNENGWRYLDSDYNNIEYYLNSRIDFGVSFDFSESYSGSTTTHITTYALDKFVGPIDVSMIESISSSSSWNMIHRNADDWLLPVFDDPVVAGNYGGAVFNFSNVDSLQLRDLVIEANGIKWQFELTTSAPQMVPLPAAAWLLATGLVGLLAARRRAGSMHR